MTAWASPATTARPPSAPTTPAAAWPIRAKNPRRLTWTATFSAARAILSNITDLLWGKKRYPSSRLGRLFGADQHWRGLAVPGLTARATQDEGNVLLVVDDAFGGDHAVLIDQEGKRRGEDLIPPGH